MAKAKRSSARCSGRKGAGNTRLQNRGDKHGTEASRVDGSGLMEINREGENVATQPTANPRNRRPKLTEQEKLTRELGMNLSERERESYQNIGPRQTRTRKPTQKFDLVSDLPPAPTFDHILGFDEKHVAGASKTNQQVPVQKPRLPHIPRIKKPKDGGSAFKNINKDGEQDDEPDLGPEPQNVKQSLIIKLPIPKEPPDSPKFETSTLPRIKVPAEDKIIRVYFNGEPSYNTVPLTLLKQAPELVLAYGDKNKPVLEQRRDSTIQSELNGGPMEDIAMIDTSSDDSDDENRSQRIVRLREIPSANSTLIKPAVPTSVNKIFKNTGILRIDNVDKCHFGTWQTWIEERATSPDGRPNRYDMRGMILNDRRKQLKFLAETWLYFAIKWNLIDFANFLMTSMRHQSRMLRGSKDLWFDEDFIKNVWKETGAGDVLRAFIMYSTQEVMHPLDPTQKVFGGVWHIHEEMEEEYEEAQDRYWDDVKERVQCRVRDWEDDYFDYQTYMLFHLDKEEKEVRPKIRARQVLRKGKGGYFELVTVVDTEELD